MKLTYYQHFKDTCPQETSLECVVEMTRSDERVARKTEAHRARPEAGHKDACPLFAVAAVMAGGKRERDIVSMTGLSMVDVDHVGGSPNEQKNKLNELFLQICADPHTLFCYRTISGNGIRVIFRYELNADDSLDQQIQFYAKVFAYGNDYYERHYGVVADGQCKNVGRLSVICHDPEAYYHAAAVPFTRKEILEGADRVMENRKKVRKQEREMKRIQARFDETIKAEVEAEGGVYATGSHNDYVMRVGYKLNQWGFSKEISMKWAKMTFPDYEKAASVVESCFQKTEEHGMRRRSAAYGSLAWMTVEDIQAFLKAHIQLRHNMITGRVEYLAEKDGEWKPVSDRIVNSLWRKMATEGRVSSQDVYRVIQSDFVAQYHPFKEYLESLENSENSESSENDYIRELAETVTVKGGPEKQQLFCNYLRKWLVAMVAGWVDDSVVNNVILVLIGPQGIYKTTWFSCLLPPALEQYFYTKTNANRMGRDDLLTLAQYGLVCCEELDTMRPAELNQLKAAVTMRSIDERAAYAHFQEHRAHIASFCGTGNNPQFLSDKTGNRRWLPFEVEQIRSPREHPFHHDGIFRQAYRLYRDGFQYWFSKEEIECLENHNKDYETSDTEKEQVDLYFRKPSGIQEGVFMPISEAIKIVGENSSLRLSNVLMGRAFMELGFTPRICQHTRGYIVVIRSKEERDAHRRRIAQGVEECLEIQKVTDVTDEPALF